MKLEIYQVGKLPPLTVVECDRWEFDYQGIGDLTLLRDMLPIAVFLLNNIAGFKVISEDGEQNGL